MKKILFVNHNAEKCGVYQYGANIFNTIKKLQGFTFSYTEIADLDHLIHAIKLHCPEAIIYNYHKVTMSFLDIHLLKKMSQIIHICLSHELTQLEINNLNKDSFDYYLFQDPELIENNPIVFKIGRVIFPYENRFKETEIPTIGTYGFGFKNKGYQSLIKIVEKEFKSAIIRINISPHSILDPYGYKAEELKNDLFKIKSNPEINLEITNYFFSQEQLLDFLAMNSINVFMYDPIDIPSLKGGISSAVDQAIAVKRPIAITNNNLFRHLFFVQPSILVKHTDINLWYRIIKRLVGICIRGDRKYLPGYIQVIRNHFFLKFNNLKSILTNGIMPLQNFYSEWSVDKFQKDFARILHHIFQKDPKIHSHSLQDLKRFD